MITFSILFSFSAQTSSGSLYCKDIKKSVGLDYISWAFQMGSRGVSRKFPETSQKGVPRGSSGVSESSYRGFQKSLKGVPIEAVAVSIRFRGFQNVSRGFENDWEGKGWSHEPMKGITRTFRGISESFRDVLKVSVSRRI